MTQAQVYISYQKLNPNKISKVNFFTSSRQDVPQLDKGT
jgi:hypothetical protein